MYANVRYNFKHVAVTIALSFLIQFIIFKVWSNNAIRLPCTSKESCYEKAIQIGGLSSRTGSLQTRMLAFREAALNRQRLKNAVFNNDNLRRNERDGAADTAGYRHIQKQIGTVKAAFVVLVRNRELDGMRESMR